MFIKYITVFFIMTSCISFFQDNPINDDKKDAIISSLQIISLPGYNLT